MTIEEANTVEDDSVFWHEIRVVHNPNAVPQIPASLFDGWPQFVRDGDYMHWVGK